MSARYKLKTEKKSKLRTSKSKYLYVRKISLILFGQPHHIDDKLVLKVLDDLTIRTQYWRIERSPQRKPNSRSRRKSNRRIENWFHRWCIAKCVKQKHTMTWHQMITLQSFWNSQKNQTKKTKIYCYSYMYFCFRTEICLKRLFKCSIYPNAFGSSIMYY